MKHAFIGIAALLIFCGHLGAQEAPEPKGISYRWFWHVYKLTALSSNPESRLTIKAPSGIKPEAIQFTPRNSNGRSVVQRNADGIVTVEWDEDFYGKDQKIYSNQPPGSLSVEFGWEFHFEEPFVASFTKQIPDLLASAWHFFLLCQISLGENTEQKAISSSGTENKE